MVLSVEKSSLALDLANAGHYDFTPYDKAIILIAFTRYTWMHEVITLEMNPVTHNLFLITPRFSTS